MTIREKKNRLLLKLIFVFIILVIILVIGYLLFDKFYSKENMTNEVNKSINYDKITKEELINIVDNELFVLDSKTKISDLTNQDKLWYSKTLYYEKNNDKIFTPKELEDYFNKTSISYLGLKHESIECIIKGDHPHLYLYDKETNTYSENSKHGGHDAISIFRIYSKLVEFKEENNKYNIKYNYLFTSTSLGDTSYNIYSNYQDAKNRTNSLGKIKYNDSFNTEIEKFYNGNYNSFQKNISTYSYFFEKVDSKIRLIDMEVQ